MGSRNLKNNILKITRGDTLRFIVPVEVDGKPYIIQSGDRVICGIMAPNSDFNCSIIRKSTEFEGDHQITYDQDGNYTVKIVSSDTYNLLPGVYYYSVKLQLDHLEDQVVDGKTVKILVQKVKTIINRTKFIIVE